jgi:Protein of unknown function (DUF3048) N-terminal domain/Protein of unknown function (DUF3048) C-terminal domain
MLKRWLMITAIALLLVVGCSKKDEVVGSQEENTGNEVIEPEVNDQEKEQPFHFPLTGVGSSTEVEGRAVAVMINNHPAARPQSGLNKADIVYELLAEGDVTRFLAIFQSEQPDNVGPVRSARSYYIELAKGFDSLYIAHGNSPDAKEMLDSGYIDALNGLYYDGTLFKRASFRKAPHNSYITYDHILKGANQKGYEMEKAPTSLTFLTADEVKEISGEAANQVSISYYDQLFNSRFEYDETLQKYKRFSNGEQSVDYETEDPILIDNLLIIETKHLIIDNSGRRDIDFTTGGKAFLVQKGKKIDVEWRNVEGRILPYKNGKVAGLVPGKTWINVMPTNPGIEQSISFE